MESHVLVAPGLRTVAQPGWRTAAGTALAVVVGQPNLWLLGAVGFLIRGGLLVLLLPIVILPTQVEVRLLLGDYLTTTGFTTGFWVLIGAAATFASVVTVAVLLALARVELGSFERILADPRVEGSAPFAATQLSDEARRGLSLRLFGIQVATFVVTIVCATPLAWAIGHTAYQEVLVPSSAASIYDRVFDAVAPQAFVFLVALIVIEAFSAMTTREVLVRAFGWRESAPRSRRLWLIPAFAAAVSRWLHSPVRTLATTASALLVTAVALVPGVAAVVIAWASVRGAFLSAVGLGDVRQDLGMGLTAVALAGAFTVAVFLGGFASALRGALWSVDRLR